MANEEILISIELANASENEKQVDDITKKINGLTKANADLNKQNKELAKTGQENSKEYLENSRQIEINKQKITESTAARKGLVQAILAEDNSIKGLQIQNANLIKQRNLLNTSTEEGRNKIAEINAQLDKNNATINENSSALEKQRFNIGNYKSALDGIVPGLGGFIDGIQNATKAGLAFIATPIGIVLAAVGAALFALTSYFKGSEEGQNRLNKLVQIGTAIFEQFMNVVEDIGEVIYDAFSNPKQAIIDFANLIKQNIINRFEGLIELIPQLSKAIGLLFKGEFVEAGKVAADAVIKVGTGIENASAKIAGFIEETANLVEQGVKNGEKLAALQAKIDKDERALTVERAKSTLEVAKLREDAITQEGELKKKTLKEAIALEEELSKKEVAFAQTRLALAQLEVKAKGDDKEALKAVAEAQANVFNAEATAFANTLKFRKQLQALDEEEIKLKQQEAAEIAKINKEIEAAEKEQFENNLKVIEENGSIRLKAIQENYLNELISKEEFEVQFANLEMTALEERKAFLIANGQSTAEVEEQIILKQIAQKEKQYAQEKAIDAARINNERQVLNARIGLAGQFGAVLSQLAGKNKALAIAGVVIQKAAALGQIVANTAVANAKAVATSPLTFGMPWVAINTISGVLSGVSVVADAAQSISEINSQKGFAVGGLTGTRINSSHGRPIRRSNGDNLLATVKTGEVILNERQQAALGGDATFRRIGVPGFAGGSFIGQSATAIASRDAIRGSEIRDLTLAVLNRPTIVTVEDINAKQNEVFSTESRAQVL